MKQEKYLGEFEVLVLAAVLRLGDEAYGVSIIAELEERAERSVSIGALYATMNRLEEKQYVSARMGEATAERGGRAKRFYTITQKGQLQLNRSIVIFNRMLSGLPGWAEVVSV